MVEEQEAQPGLFTTYFTTKATVIILIINIVLSLSIGSTIGIVPEVLQDRYARLYHDYEGPDCSSYSTAASMPQACQHGADDAQDGSAMGSLALNILTLFCNPVVGSLSDSYGRRSSISIGMFLCILPPLVLVLMQLLPRIPPVWYYAATSSGGIISYTSIFIASISEVVPEELRAPCIGIMIAGFSGSLSLAPALPLVMSHFLVSLLSLSLTVLAFVISVVFLPETLPDVVVSQNRRQQPSEISTSEETTVATTCRSSLDVTSVLSMPFQKVAILNRTTMLRLLTVGAFFASMVYSADINLVLFYMEAHLNFRDQDIARLFFVSGAVGLIVQVVLLQPLIRLFGEKWLLVATFACGSLHNFLYGISKDQTGIWAAFLLSQFTHLNYPLLSSFASKGALETEQGQVQGALSAISALAAALGPVLMQSIYDYTKDIIIFGPGTMFVFAALLYLTGTIIVSFLQVDQLLSPHAVASPSSYDEEEEEALSAQQPFTPTDGLEEPLLPQSTSDD